MPDEPDRFAEETLWLREETQRLINLSRAERKMCDSLVDHYLAIFAADPTLEGDGTHPLPQDREG
jgi:hypothetical protein